MSLSFKNFGAFWADYFKTLGIFFLHLAPWLIVTAVMLKASYVLGYQDRFMVFAIPVCIVLLLMFPHTLNRWLQLLGPNEKVKRAEVIHAFFGYYIAAIFFNLGINPWITSELAKVAP